MALQSTLSCLARRNWVQRQTKDSLFWTICVIAAATLGASFVLVITSGNSTVRFVCALLSLVAVSTVQKFTVLKIVVKLSHRGQLITSILLDIALVNWTEASLAVIAVLKSRSHFAQAFLIGTVTTNNLLLLGGSLLDERAQRREHKYPMMMALMYIRLLVVCIAFLLFPTALSQAPQAVGVDCIKACRLLATLLLVVFMCHAALICNVHSESTSSLQDNLLNLCSTPKARVSFAESVSDWPIDSSVCKRLQEHRSAWLRTKVAADKGARSAPCRPLLEHSAVTAALLILSCVAVLAACILLVGAFPSPGSEHWLDSVCVGYLLVPLCTALANLVARHLEGRQYAAKFGSNELIYGAVTTSHRLLYAIFPACIFAEWITDSTASTMLPGTLQVATLSLAVVLPAYLMTTGKDDWLTGVTLLMLYTLFVGCVWIMS